MGKKAKRRDAADQTDARRDGAIPGEELELKLEIAPADAVALLATPPLDSADATERAQDSTYFDTPDRVLRHAGFSLRVRRIGDRYIQTVKAEGAAAAGLFARPEWERDIADATPLPRDDAAPLRGLIPDAALDRLEPIFHVKVNRTTVLVTQDDASVEIVFDRGEVTAADRSDPIHEVEFELKGGNPAALFALARTIGRTVPLRLGVLTKSDRGYGLDGAATDKAVKAGPVALQPGMSTAAGFRAIVGACLRQFRLNEAILMRTGGAGALHQARVALRRLRSALSTFGAVVRDERYDHVRAELRWIAGVLGQARNLDVMLGRMPGKNKDAARPLRAARKRAYATVEEALASARLRAAMLDLSEWTTIGDWGSDPDRAELRDRPVEAFAGAALERHRRRLKRFGRQLDEVSDDERHEARIEAKKLRYATEFFATLFPGKKAIRRHGAFLDGLEALQAHLGDLNDLATAPEVLAELDLVGTPTADALQPDMSRREPLLGQAMDAHEALMDQKRFWR